MPITKDYKLKLLTTLHRYVKSKNIKSMKSLISSFRIT